MEVTKSAYSGDLLLSGVVHRSGALTLDIPELRAEHGSATLLLGESGCGKSTLLRILAGFTDPDEGQVTRPSGEPGVLLLQNPRHQILRTLVREELSFGLENRISDDGSIRRMVDETASEFRLTEHLDRDPRSLSLGELQRLMLAATFLSQGHVVLLDEPTSHLDRRSGEDFSRILTAQKAAGRIIILSSQYAEDMDLCDTVWFMEQGQIRKIIQKDRFRELQEYFRETGFTGAENSCS